MESVVSCKPSQLAKSPSAISGAKIISSFKNNVLPDEDRNLNILEFKKRSKAEFEKYLNSIPVEDKEKSRILKIPGLFFESLPKFIDTFNYLTTVYCSGNFFEEIPDCLFDLEFLEIVHMNRNSIRYVSGNHNSELDEHISVIMFLGNIWKWKHLKELHLSTNYIR